MRTARAMVFSDTFWLNALFLVLPFVLVLLAAIAILRRVDRADRRDRADHHRSDRSAP